MELKWKIPKNKTCEKMRQNNAGHRGKLWIETYGAELEAVMVSRLP